MASWVIIAPFGFAVVPDVYMMNATSRSITRRPAAWTPPTETPAPASEKSSADMNRPPAGSPKATTRRSSDASCTAPSPRGRNPA